MQPSEIARRPRMPDSLRNWTHQNEEDAHWNRRASRLPAYIPPYPQGEASDYTYSSTPWRLFEERVRTGPYRLNRFPLQPYSPVRILIVDGGGGVNPRLRQFIQNSPPRIRGEWQLQQQLTEPEDPGLTQEEFNSAMKKLRKQLYSPRRWAWRRGGLFGGRAGEEDASESRDCAICLETLVAGEQVLVTPCSHMFHHDCLVPWVKSRGQCPVCRLELCERRAPAASPSRRRAGAGYDVGDQEMALDLVYLMRAMEEAFNWINLSR